MKKYARILLIIFYLVAGANHFVNPEFYLPLIPDYLPWKNAINFWSGIAEIILAFGFTFPKTRKWAAIGVVAMLIAFIPSHWHFIQIGGCVEGGLCVPEWVPWVRLFPLHFLLMAWAWWVR